MAGPQASGNCHGARRPPGRRHRERTVEAPLNGGLGRLCAARHSTCRRPSRRLSLPHGSSPTWLRADQETEVFCSGMACPMATGVFRDAGSTSGKPPDIPRCRAVSAKGPCGTCMPALSSMDDRAEPGLQIEKVIRCGEIETLPSPAVTLSAVSPARKTRLRGPVAFHAAKGHSASFVTAGRWFPDLMTVDATHDVGGRSDDCAGPWLPLRMHRGAGQRSRAAPNKKTGFHMRERTRSRASLQELQVQ